MPLNIDFQQILLHMLNFVLLFTILYVLLYKPVRQFMEKREAYYRGLDEEAKQNLKESQETRDQVSRRLENMEEELAGMREESRKEAEELSRSIVAEAREQASRVITEAKAEGSREKERIVASAGDEISQMVTAATAKIVFADTDSAYEDFLNTVEGSEQHEQA